MIEVSWEVSDGYVGKSRPQAVRIDPVECEGMTREEIEQHIYDSVQDDFEQKVTWDVSDIDGAIAAVQAELSDDQNA